MDNKLAEKIERLEAQLPRWEKWLYACFGVAFTMLIHAFIKAHENQLATEAFFMLEKEAGSDLTFPSQLWLSFSSWRPLLWLFVQFATLVPAAILAFHSAWRKVTLNKRLDLIFGFLLAGWVTLLSLGAQDPLNAPNGYNTLVVVYLLALGLGYWWLRRKKERAEEVFP